MECESVYKDLEDFCFSKQAPRRMPYNPDSVKSYECSSANITG
jgi:hypothetical protein